jgi:hypothetical protein
MSKNLIYIYILNLGSYCGPIPPSWPSSLTKNCFHIRQISIWYIPKISAFLQKKNLLTTFLHHQLVQRSSRYWLAQSKNFLYFALQSVVTHLPQPLVISLTFMLPFFLAHKRKKNHISNSYELCNYFHQYRLNIIRMCTCSFSHENS